MAALLTAAPGRAQQVTAPEVAGGGAIEVQVSFFLMDVLRILDAEQSVEADVFYRLEWRDERLAEAGVEQRALEPCFAPQRVAGSQADNQ